MMKNKDNPFSEVVIYFESVRKINLIVLGKESDQMGA